MDDTQITTDNWNYAKSYYQEKKLYMLDEELEMMDVLYALQQDQSEQLKIWIESGLVYVPTPKEVQEFAANIQMQFKFCLVEPYLLMQRS